MKSVDVQVGLLADDEALELYSRPMAKAFVGYPIAERTFRDSPGSQEEWLFRMIQGTAEFRRKSHARLPVARVDGAIVAAANLRLPDTLKPDGIDEWFDSFLKEAGPTAADFMPRFIQSMDHIRFPEPHAYLIMIGVAPAYQNQGIGKRLIDYCCELAVGCGCCGIGLDTQDRKNVEIYRRCGFKVHEELALEDIPIFSMWRDLS